MTSMNGPARYDDAVEALYDAATSDTAWQRSLDVLSAHAGAAEWFFSAFDDHLGAIASDSLRDTNRLYREWWWREDVFLHHVLAPPIKAGVILDSDFDDRIDRQTHPFFRDFLYARGWGRFAAYVSPVILGARFLLQVQRMRDNGPFRAEEIDALRFLAPHVVRSLAIAGQVRIAQSRETALLSFLDRIGYGAAIIGHDTRVKGTNDTALRLLGDGLALQDTRVVETFSTPRGMVDRLVKMAMTTDGGLSTSALVHRPSGRKPLVLQAFAFPGTASWTVTSRSDAALLLLIDTEGDSHSDKLEVMQSFGLTAAEARVAGLVGSGLSPAEAADQLGSAAARFGPSSRTSSTSWTCVGRANSCV